MVNASTGHPPSDKETQKEKAHSKQNVGAAAGNALYADASLTGFSPHATLFPVIQVTNLNHLGLFLKVSAFLHLIAFLSMMSVSGCESYKSAPLSFRGFNEHRNDK